METKSKIGKMEYIKRYTLFFIGIIINSFGVSFVTKASLGTSPISSIPYVLSLKFIPTLGMFTLYVSMLLIFVQLILLREKFPKSYFLQIPVTIIFAYFIDVTMKLLSFIKPETYYMKLIYLLIGCLILGFGVFLEMIADVVMLPGEAFVNAVSTTFHTDFGKTKVVFDSTMTISAGIIGMVLCQSIVGVREGTIIAAILVGMIARAFKRKFGFMEQYLVTKENRENGEIRYKKLRFLDFLIPSDY